MSLTPPVLRKSEVMGTTTGRFAAVPTAATIAHRTERTIWQWLANGALTRYRAGARTVVDLDELDALIAPRPA
jgi:hypothetical protein